MRAALVPALLLAAFAIVLPDPTPLAAAGGGVPPAVVDALQREWGAVELERISLTWPAHADPVSGVLRLEVPIDGGLHTLVLQPRSLRAPDFRVQAWDPVQGLRDVPMPAAATFRGVVDGWPESVAVVSFTAAGCTAFIQARTSATGPGRSGGATPPSAWRIEPLARYLPGAAPDEHVLFRPGPVALACGVDDLLPAVFGPASAGGAQPFGAVTPTNCDFKRCEIAFDCDHAYYLQQGATVPATVARVEAILNDVEFFYARDLRVTYTLTHVIVRTAPFYADISGGTLLDDFRAEWNSNQGAVPRDIAHLMTNKTNLSGYAGLAWVGVVCTSFGYGWSVDSAGVVGHEIGHNWSAGHCHDTSPCNNMCGACLFIGSNTRDVMLAHRATRTCLDDVPPYTDPLPPYARLNTLGLSEADLLGGGSFLIDVLSDDHDGNCDPIFVSGVDATSARGASVAISAGTGAGGFDQVTYTPPASGFAGDDTFAYTVSDGTAGTPGEVVVRVRRPVLAAHWRFDETHGLTARDTSGFDRPGTLQGGVSFDVNALPGIHGGALALDGTDDAVHVTPLDLHTSALTITAWVRRTGSQVAWAGLVFSRAGNTVAGMSLGTAHELRYHWNGGQYPWNSGLVVPDGQWCFVALVVEPTGARMYLEVGTSGVLQTALQSGAHGIEEFDGDLFIGMDPTTTPRPFRGAIDDVRIYRYALDSAQIAEVAAGGWADAPRPAHLENQADRHPVLSWQPGYAAVAHDIYWGADPLAVAAAGPTSPEYRGRHGSSGFHPLPVLAAGESWAWAVDTVRPDGSVHAGVVWRLTTGTLLPAAGLRLHFPLDVGTISGLTVLDQSGAPITNGTLQGGPAQVAGQVGGAVQLDGINDRIQVPALQLHSNTVTLAAWIRRSGPQTGTNGIIFSRAGTTTAGLNLGNHHELRYHWQGSHWWWDSGLEVPDGVWCHVALVIEPTRARLYLDGASAQHDATHGPEAFDGVLMIGQDAGFSTRYFAGSIDEVAIWNRALSRDEIFQRYAGGRVGRPVQGNLDTLPPQPSPLAWAQTPTALGVDRIEMRAVTATDPAAVEYRFLCVAGPGTSSDWQQSPYYVDVGLAPGSTCTYLAVARDRSAALNEGAPTAPGVATTEGTLFLRADANLDGAVNISDAIRILGYLFDAQATGCLLAFDANDDDSVDIADAIAVLGYLFGGGPLPAPTGACGLDPTPDVLDCAGPVVCP